MIHRRGNDAHRQTLQWPTILLIRRGRAHEFESETNARREQRSAGRFDALIHVVYQVSTYEQVE